VALLSVCTAHLLHPRAERRRLPGRGRRAMAIGVWSLGATVLQLSVPRRGGAESGDPPSVPEDAEAELRGFVAACTRKATRCGGADAQAAARRATQRQGLETRAPEPCGRPTGCLRGPP
jgi:hypothetical protein